MSWQEVGDGVYRRCAGHTDNDLVVLVADAGVALERTTLTAARLSS